ncbi:MAG: hypothetical protein AAF495_07075 [Pseudomonadota bacterium]
MSLNPEFRRNLWLELTPQRLLLMPIILGLFFAIAAQMGSAANDAIDRVGGIMFILLVVLWGCRRAAASVAGEVREGTWDWQRMSALGPWSMAWGKLLGSTAFVWYGGIICLAAMAYARSSQIPGDLLALHLASTVMAALIGQSVSLAACLAWLRKTRPTRRLPVTLCHIFGLIVAYGFMEWGFWERMLYVAQSGDTASLVDHYRRPILWYGLSLEATTFRLLSLAAFLGWSLLAVHRLMRAELQVKQWPWAWLAFTLFLALYANGFLVAGCAACGDSPFWSAFLGFVIAVAGAYLALFLEAKDVVRLRGLRAALGVGTWGRALTLTPTWLPATGLAGFFGVLAMAASGTIPPLDWASSYKDLLSAPNPAAISAGILSQLAFLMRDFALVVGLNLSERRKRADLAALVYLLVLYGLVPVLLQTIGLDWAWVAFWPFDPNHPWLNLALAAAQAGIAIAFMAWRWGRLQATLLAPRPSGE